MPKVFYRLEQSCPDAVGYSPSAGKPALVVADWLEKGLVKQNDIMSFEPVPNTTLWRAHSVTFVEAILMSSMRNGFGNTSKAVAKSLPYTTGSLLAAAEYAIAKKTHTCSPTSGFHHAGHHTAEGFCTFNGLMVTAIYLKEHGLANTVGILDLDFHYGNGTDDIIAYFSEQGRDMSYVKHHTSGRFFHSEHQTDRYFAWLRKAIADLQGCDVVLYQAGADAFIGDEIGGMLTETQMTQRDRMVFEGLRDAPLSWTLAGGYSRDVAGTIEPVLALHRQTMRECIRLGG